MLSRASLEYSHYDEDVQIASVSLVRNAAGAMFVPSASSARILLRTNVASKDASNAILICGQNANIIISSRNASPEG